MFSGGFLFICVLGIVTNPGEAVRCGNYHSYNACDVLSVGSHVRLAPRREIISNEGRYFGLRNAVEGDKMVVLVCCDSP